jgi:hypothetical protein
MKLLLVFALGMLTAGAVAAQGLPGPVPAPVTVRNEVTVQAPPPDPAVVRESAVESGQAIVISVITPPPVQWDNQLLDLPDVWRTTPPDLTYNNPNIRQLAELIRGVSFGLIALAIFAMGASHALGGGLPMQWGRLLFAAVLSVGNLIWWEIGIDLNNAITASIHAPEVATVIRPHLEMPADPAQAFGDAVLVLVYAVVALLTLFTLLTRLGLIEVLIAGGSLMLLLYAIEESSHWATGYVRVSVGVTYSQVLIVIGLVTAQVLGTIGTGLAASLVGIAVLLLVRGLPSTLAGMGRSGGSDGGLFGRLVQLVVLRRLAR